MRAGLISAVVCVLAGTFPGAAHAQETLYGKQPPRGSAFVRFANATPGDATVTTDFQADLHLGVAPADRVAPYAVVEKAADRPLSITVKEGGHEGRFTYKAPADGYVTIVMEQDSSGSVVFVPIVDQADFNQTRARLAFYNAASGCASATLALDPSGPVVFQNVPSGATKSRTVNPVQATVRAACADSPGPTLALGGMELGASYSIWLIRPGADAMLFLTPDVSARYKPRS
jgi:hypothetical protein